MTDSRRAPNSDVEVLRAIRQIAQRISEHSRYLLKHTGLSVPQVLCLRALEEGGDEGMTNLALAGLLNMSPPTSSRVLDRLERAGLVERRRSDVDRRKVFVTLTDDGTARTESLPAALHEPFIERYNALPEARRQAVLDALQLVAELMSAADEPPTAT